MVETTQIQFSHKEVVVALLKQQGIHEGIWSLAVKFGIQAMNIGTNATDILPAAIVPLMSIGLRKVDEENALSVDASQVNPKPTEQPPT